MGSQRVRHDGDSERLYIFGLQNHCRWFLYQLSYQGSPRAIAIVYRINAGVKVEAQSNQRRLFWIEGDGICKVREAREGVWPYSGNSQ